MPSQNPRRRRSAGPGRLTLSEIALLVGVCVKTLRRRLLTDAAIMRHYWVQTLDLKKQKSGLHGLGVSHVSAT